MGVYENQSSAFLKGKKRWSSQAAPARGCSHSSPEMGTGWGGGTGRSGALPNAAHGDWSTEKGSYSVKVTQQIDPFDLHDLILQSQSCGR